jgi:hypothetical protein
MSANLNTVPGSTTKFLIPTQVDFSLENHGWMSVLTVCCSMA